MSGEQKTVLCFSGNDPSGGAGIQADIETLAKHHAHCLPLITLNTVQDSKGIEGIHKTPDEFLQKQFELIQKDIPIHAIKLGLLADVEQILCVKKLIQSKPTVPVILDPVLASGLGSEIKNQEFINALCSELLPLSFICTPNFPEAQKLSASLKDRSEFRFDALANSLLSKGAQHVLITGTHHDEHNNTITHRLFGMGNQELIEKTFNNKRLQYSYHGSGCTLSSAIAANIANGCGIDEAVSKALDFTFHALENANKLGNHQLFPKRF